MAPVPNWTNGFLLFCVRTAAKPFFQAVVESLTGQTRAPDALYLHLPRKHGRVEQEWVLPDWLLELNASAASPLRVHFMEEDYGKSAHCPFLSSIAHHDSKCDCTQCQSGRRRCLSLTTLLETDC